MVEEKSNNNERVQVAITQPAFKLIELEREQIFKKTGVTKPRYEIASEAIIKAYGGKDGNA